MRRFFPMLFLVASGGILLAQTSAGDCSDDRAYLGIYTNSVSEEKAGLLGFPTSEGSMINEVLPGGAADRAGLQPFDYIFGIDDYRTDDDDDLTDLLGKYKAGEQATVHFMRDGRPMSVDLTFGRQADSSRRKRSENDKPFLGVSNRDASDDEPGVTVNVISNSTAKEMGLKSGDKITAINHHPIIDWSDISTALQMMEVGDPVTVDFEREGREMNATSVLKSHEATYDEAHYEQQEVERAFLGVYSNTISTTKAHKLGFENPYGSYVASVIPNTAAERAGIQPFDYIYGIDQYRTAEGQSLTYILSRYEVGDRAVVHFVRKSQDRQAQVTFGSREDRRETQVDKCNEPLLGVQSNHVYVERSGVSVDIRSNSTAEALGMQDGDVIIRINDYPMIDWEDVGAAIDNMQVGETIQVVWIRAGREMKGSRPIMSYCETTTNQIIYQDGSRNIRPDIARRAPDALDLKLVEVIVSDVNRDEAAEMKRRYNIELNLDNTLGMRSIKIATYPEKGLFQLSLDLPNRGQTVIRIYNNQGRNIYEYDLGTFSGQFSDEVDLSQNGVGTYYLQVQQNDKAASKRLLLRKG